MRNSLFHIVLRKRLGLFLPLLAVSFVPLSAQPVDFTVRAEGFMPEQLFLLRETERGFTAIDSVWEGVDGLYHPRIEEFSPALYSLRLGEQAALPLLLSERPEGLHITILGDPAIKHSAIESAKEAERYRLVKAAELDLDFYSFLATQARFHEGQSAQVLDTLVAVKKGELNRLADSILSEADDALLRAFTLLCRQPEANELGAWWPEELLSSTAAAVARSSALREHLKAYYYAQVSTDYSRREQDSAFMAAIRFLENSHISRDIAERLQAYTRLFFENAGYHNLAAAAAIVPPLFRSERKEITPKEALTWRVKGIEGRKQNRLIDKKTDYTLVILWSVWCPSCQEVMAEIDAWFKEQKPAGLRVHAITVDRCAPSLATYIKGRGWQWWNSCEENTGSSELLQALNYEGTPHLLIFNSRGELVSEPRTVQQLKNEFK